MTHPTQEADGGSDAHRRSVRGVSRPLAIDLFCGAGGASMGLYRAGFDVIGIDIKPQPRYPFRFIQADALKPPLDLSQADFIWASPPCQAYSNLTPVESKGVHLKLIVQVRDMLKATGTAYCIENVAGAKRDLINPFMLCGSMFGLRTQRHRYFETSFFLLLSEQCDHGQVPLLVTTASAASRAVRAKAGIPYKTVRNAPLAYGIDWMDFAGLTQAIPPAYSEFIGRAALAYLAVESEAA